MAEVNSLSAAKAGANYIDTTIAGIGERAGNCDFVKFINIIGKTNLRIDDLKLKEKMIKNIMKLNILN